MLATLAPERRGDSLADKQSQNGTGVSLTVSPGAHKLVQHGSHLRLGRHVLTLVERANVVCESLLLAELLRTHAASSTARPPSLGSSTAAYFTLQGQLNTVKSSATVSVLLSMLNHRLRCDHTFFATI